MICEPFETLYREEEQYIIILDNEIIEVVYLSALGGVAPTFLTHVVNTRFEFMLRKEAMFGICC